MCNKTRKITQKKKETRCTQVLIIKTSLSFKISYFNIYKKKMSFLYLFSNLLYVYLVQQDQTNGSDNVDTPLIHLLRKNCY